MIRSHKLPNQKPEEKTLLVLRRHWLVPCKILFLFLLAAAVPIALYFFFSFEYPTILTDSFTGPALAVAASFYYLAIWMFTFQEIIDYYLDLWIVTTERVMSIEQFGLFKRTSSELHLENILDVTSQVQGMWHTFLNFGDVLVETAGEHTRFHFKEIPRPEAVREMVLKAVDEDRARHARSTTTNAPST